MLNRRAWIAANLLGLAGAARADDPVNLDIIDCHTHFYDPERPEGIPWPEKGSSLYRQVLPKHLKALKQYRRVTGTVIVEASPRVEDNAWLLEIAKNDPFIVGIVGNLKPGSPGFAAQVERFAANQLFRGIRVDVSLVGDHLKKDELRDYVRLADHDLVLDVNGGPETPAVIAQLAPRVPNLRIVLNHIGNVAITAEPPPRDWQDGIRAAANHPNVFSKISALVEGAGRDGKKPPADLAFYKPYVDIVWNAFGDDRVIYGSNWPVSELAASYELLQRIVMEYAESRGAEAMKKFCSLNAKHAYKWVDRPGRSKLGS